MNIIREADALRFGLEINHSDCDILHGTNCKAVFCGTASNVLIEIGRVKATACFFVMPNMDHAILLGRLFLYRTETLMFYKHDGTLILILCDPTCGNYEIITCRNTDPRSIRNRPKSGSFTIEESKDERRRFREEPQEEAQEKVFSLSLSDVNKAMDIVATHEMADPDAIHALREQVLECPQAGEVELIYRLPGGRRDPAMMQAQVGYEQKAELVLKPFEEEDPWGGKDVQWMMKLTLTGEHSLVEEVKTIEEGSNQVEKHKELIGGMYLLVNTLLQGNFDQVNSLNPAENKDTVSESQDDEFEEVEIKEAFRAEEYDEIYLELRLLLSCEMRDRDASERAQKMRQLYLIEELDETEWKDWVSGTRLKKFVAKEERSKRQRDPKPREAMPSRGGRKALARREEESVPEAEERGAYPDCGLGPMFFHRFTGGGLRGSPQHEREEVPPPGGALQESEVHLDILRWRVPQTDERRDDPAGGVPREEVHEPVREAERDAQGGRVIEEVINVGEDTSPRTSAPETGPKIMPDVAREAGEELQQGEAPPPLPYVTLSPGVRVEMERERIGWRREALSTIDRYLAAHAQEHPDIERPMKPPREPHQAEREALVEIPEREGHRTRGRAPTVEAEVRELRALVISQYAIIQDLRQQPRDMATKMEREAPTKIGDWTESRRYDIQSEALQGLFRPPYMAGPSHEPSIGKAILELEEAKAKREAEREALEVKAPTELAAQLMTSSRPATESSTPRAGDRPRTTVSEPALGSDEGSMNVLLEAVDTMQEEASLFMLEQRVEEPNEGETVVAMADVFEGRPQRLDTSEYRPEGVGIRLEPST
ncbi:hypothetical protein CBR_g36576 [Chara braunii]|uniref:Uncharacterized protein n=1 Tax=Chara braunii TaxID=69332 RepID=A0A388JZ60_CHABU|nr:hypothetical protein CBR_g36576 [Chara braunii]|eukprot:GBG63090.1 hypothetical protein CBR_g36576 [Chara braunii]